ncbi:hypothetical protein EVAR_45307_1 [Eumeta japonica]|uniref:Serine proteinase stubble n=1 Tax=Eumeta variegata TaxID=151549 RepID=A0A4C1XQ01_EUMVA|nr:hypothetical protein EVAR_45307_1 [Eumeta japonica]
MILLITDSRKLFGGYRITPAYCKASRASKFNRGNTICMFNHECAQRGGEVVGACMDGFLFGACCQLKSDSQSHIPKGPGVVMTSYLDYPDAEQEEEFDESDDLNAWHNSFKPVVTPGYRPTDKNHGKEPIEKTTEQYSSSLSSEIISEGVSQITNTLLNSPPKDSNIIYMRPGQNDGIYSYSTITHGMADTILIGDNGSEDSVARPSDFTVHIPPLQTNFIGTTMPPSILSTNKPVKPVFRPKPTTKPDKTTFTTKLETKNTPMKPISSTEKYTLSTEMKETQKVTELTSLQSPITSIIQMLNESTPALSKIETSTSSATIDSVETKSSPKPSTVDFYSGSFLPQYSSTGHYVTLKPSQSVTILSSTPSYSTTSKPIIFNKFSTSSSKRPQDKLTTSVYSSSTQFSSPRPIQSTSQDIDSFNRYPTNPDKFDDSITTFTYVTSSTTPKPIITKKPPSTSYIYGTQPSLRPATSSSSIIPNYEIVPDTFASMTPTVIVLNDIQTTKPESSTEDKEPQFVEIPQEPFKKPINQITVNNHIQSTNNIYMGKPPSYDRPSSPTIVITPKPSLATTPLPSKYSTRPLPTSTSSSSTTILGSSSSIYDIITDVYSPTTFKPEMQTSPDDLINFPPVRNPMLNTTGVNSGMFNTSISISDSELDLLHDIEFTTPSFLQEDENLNEKMNLFVNKIVGSLQGTFQELHDIVILDKKPNATKPNANTKTTTAKPSKKPAPTRKPVTTTKRPPLRTTTTKKPQKTTKGLLNPPRCTGNRLRRLRRHRFRLPQRRR